MCLFWTVPNHEEAQQQVQWTVPRTWALNGGKQMLLLIHLALLKTF